MPKRISVIGEDLRDRLVSITTRHSLSEVARKTGTPFTSVHRYVNGGRIPAEFCTALVTAFGLNPTWLLTGEGARHTSDVELGITKMADDLLDLVNAMSAVSKMRLGALAGKHHAKVLRQLNDALMHYEKLRLRINRQSAPLFSELIEGMENALDALDFTRADDFRGAVLQVSRLCDEPELERRFIELEARAEFHDGNYEQAIELTRKLVRHNITRGKIIGDDDTESLVRIALMIWNYGNYEEAARLLSGVRELIGPIDESAPPKFYAFLCTELGSMYACLGQAARGMAMLMKWAPRLQGRRRISGMADICKHQLMMGTVSLEGAVALEPHAEPKAVTIVRFATLMEDPDMLETALSYFDDSQVFYANSDFPETDYARILHGLLTAKPPNEVLKKFKSWQKGTLDANDDDPEPYIFEAQLMRIMGKRREATRAFRKSEDLIGNLGRANFMPHVTHCRTAILLIPSDTKGADGKARRRCMAKIRAWVDSGYNVLRPWLS